jgi:transmembrane sensor
MQKKSVSQSASQSIDQRINHSVRNFYPPFEIEKDAALNSVLLKIKEPRKHSTAINQRVIWIRAASGVAAAIIAGVLFWVVFSVQTIQNEGKIVATFRLPDQSRVVLSPGGSVSYRTFIWNKQLKLQGKAYFEVEKGGKFKVSAPTGTVEVLGTRFSVEGYSKEMRVICFEGKVMVRTEDSNQLLLPGNGVECIPGAKDELIKKEASYPDFALFAANYHNQALGEVLKDIRQFFGVEIDNRIASQRYFTGSIHTGNLETALSIITGSLEVKYEFTGKNFIRIVQINK